jgi:pyridoxamine 5'-phosphate oxidase|tara:strand:- start:37 stop:675 length:639 start_codon:yes stop_codon:yes gene_type:complete
MNLGNLRESYTQASLNKKQVNIDPLDQFSEWFKDARNAKLKEPNAMNLSTVDAEGQPSVRTVLLKSIADDGFVFYTNYKSRKSVNISLNSKVALHFLWLPLERQVSIQGTAEKISQEDSLSYFLSRPRGSQLGAWVSDQSREISSKELLVEKMNALLDKFGDGEIPIPEFWGGFKVKPNKIEFWQGGEDRLHDRIEYFQGLEGNWKIRRLCP